MLFHPLPPSHAFDTLWECALLIFSLFIFFITLRSYGFYGDLSFELQLRQTHSAWRWKIWFSFHSSFSFLIKFIRKILLRNVENYFFGIPFDWRQREDECHEPQFNYIFFAFIKFIVENLSTKISLGDFSDVKIYDKKNSCFWS